MSKGTLEIFFPKIMLISFYDFSDYNPTSKFSTMSASLKEVRIALWLLESGFHIGEEKQHQYDLEGFSFEVSLEK